MPINNLTQLRTLAPELTPERLSSYLVEAGKEFSFTGFSTYFAVAKRTLQLTSRDGLLEGLEAEERNQLLSEPDGLIVREISSLLGEAESFPSAWRFVRRDWTFSPQFRSLLGAVIDPDNPVSGPLMQRYIARACGVPIPLDATHVPLEFRRER